MPKKVIPQWLHTHIVNRLLELIAEYKHGHETSDFYAKMYGKYRGQLFRYREEYVYSDDE